MYLRLHDDGGLALVDSQFNRPLWDFNTTTLGTAEPDVEVLGHGIVAGDTKGGTLNRGQAIVSPDGQNVMVLTRQGTLRVRNMITQRETVLVSGGGDTLRLQSNGNLVLRDSAGADIWSSGTYHRPEPGAVNRAFTLGIGDDGIANLQDPLTGVILWSSAQGVLAQPQPVELIAV